MDFSEIKTFYDLSFFLGISANRLHKIFFDKKIYESYKEIIIPKKNGGERKIDIPCDELKLIQKNLLEGFQTIFNYKDKFCHGFVKQRSIYTNARKHIKQKVVISYDLENFFESFTFVRVLGYLKKSKKLSFNDNVSYIVARLLTYNDKLPQGAPSSPMITNLICGKMDYDLHLVAKKYGFYFSRYADDLTFSTKSYLNINKRINLLTREIEYTINKNGFLINHKKTNIKLQNKPQMVTGLVVNKKVNVSKQYYRLTRSMAFNYFYFEKNDNKLRDTIYGRFLYILNTNLFMCGKNNLTRIVPIYRFVFFDTFINNSKPTIITEGKTDSRYIKAALKKFKGSFDYLISNDAGKNQIKLSFISTDSTKASILKLTGGASTLLNLIIEFKLGSYFSKHSYLKDGKKLLISKQPLIFIFDHEYNQKNKNKCLNKLESTIKDNFKNNYEDFNDLFDNSKNNCFKINCFKNIYVMTLPNLYPDDKEKEYEIEDLFPKEFLEQEFNGKKFVRDGDIDVNKQIGKNGFSLYIKRHCNSIDEKYFENFRKMLSNIEEIIKSCI